MGDHTLQVTGGLAELGLGMDQVKVGENAYINCPSPCDKCQSLPVRLVDLLTASSSSYMGGKVALPRSYQSERTRCWSKV